MDIRTADITDAQACAEIYAPYVTDTAITFEDTPPTRAEMEHRIDEYIEWIVAEGTEVVGYAYASPHHPRAAYRWSCDVSVYLSPAAHGNGLGKRLYRELLERLEARGYRMACAIITQPNDASMALHHTMGFRTVGTYTDIGFKHGSWRDVTVLQKALGQSGPPRGEPR